MSAREAASFPSSGSSPVSRRQPTQSPPAIRDDESQRGQEGGFVITLAMESESPGEKFFMNWSWNRWRGHRTNGEFLHRPQRGPRRFRQLHREADCDIAAGTDGQGVSRSLRARRACGKEWDRRRPGARLADMGATPQTRAGGPGLRTLRAGVEARVRPPWQPSADRTIVRPATIPAPAPKP